MKDVRSKYTSDGCLVLIILILMSDNAIYRCLLLGEFRQCKYGVRSRTTYELSYHNLARYCRGHQARDQADTSSDAIHVGLRRTACDSGLVLSLLPVTTARIA